MTIHEYNNTINTNIRLILTTHHSSHLHQLKSSQFLRFASDFTKIIETVGGFEALIRFLQDTRELKAKALALGEDGGEKVVGVSLFFVGSALV